MLLAAGIEKNTKKARKKLETAIDSGLAAEKFEQIIEAQGGNPKVVEDPSVLPQAQAVEVFSAPRTGVVQRVEPRISPGPCTMQRPPVQKTGLYGMSTGSPISECPFR